MEVYPVLFSERNGYPSPMPDRRRAFIKGYEQAEKDLGWHSVDECLPPIDEEVIVLANREVIDLTNRMHGKELPYVRCLCFAHRTNPNGWDGKDFETGEVKHYDVGTYNGWNIPGVKYWMPRPKIPEEL